MSFFNRTTYWYPENQDPIRIKDLSTDHFVNILNWISIHHPDWYADDVRAVFEDERKIRNMLAFVKREPYAEKVNGEYMLVGKE